jgi:hypothetical protein
LKLTGRLAEEEVSYPDLRHRGNERQINLTGPTGFNSGT